MRFAGFRGWRPRRTTLLTWRYMGWPPAWCCPSLGQWRADAAPCCPPACSRCTRCTRTPWLRWSAGPTCCRACSSCCRSCATAGTFGPGTATVPIAANSSKGPAAGGHSRAAPKTTPDVRRPLTWCFACCLRSCPCCPRKTVYPLWPCASDTNSCWG